MEWYHIFVIVYLVIAIVGALLFSESCSGLVGSLLVIGGLIWALNAGNFFA